MKNILTLYSLQMLRAIAAALVLLAHSQNFLYARGKIPELNPLIHFGSVGVDIFFVISGFIMVLVSRNKFQQPGASVDFIIRRIIRVVPTYWLYTCLLAALLILLPEYFSGGKQFDISHFIASLFFIPWPNNVGAIMPVLGVGWTLNNEIYFYCIFSLLLLVPFRSFLLYLSFILLTGVFLGAFLNLHIAQLSVVTSPLVIEFLLGSFIGVIYISNINISLSVAKLFILTGTIGFILTSTPLLADVITYIGYPKNEYERIFKWGVPAAMLIMGIIHLEREKALPINRFLVSLGDSSYSLYLTHIFVINALGVLWIRFFHDYYNAYITVSFFLAMFIGHIAYLLIEKPLLVKLNKEYYSYKSNCKTLSNY